MTLQLYTKKKIEIYVEAPRARKIIEAIEGLGAKGYSIVRDVVGKGNRGVRDEGHVSSVFSNVLIVTIVAPPIAQAIVEACHGLLESYAGIVTISDVQVVRDEHF